MISPRRPGPVSAARLDGPGPAGAHSARSQPARSFETVTCMIDGIFQHQDSNGGGPITDGDTNG
jgi:redox-sensitive bicupin YhaK (pirin superfamily)